jgi:hypothetical protein
MLRIMARIMIVVGRLNRLANTARASHQCAGSDGKPESLCASMPRLKFLIFAPRLV